MFDISPRRVVHVILRARELEAKVGAWGGAGDGADTDKILASRRGDATADELSAFIANLPEDHQAELVAIMWVGRDTFEPEEFADAVTTALEEKTTPTEDYLLGVPQLSDYLENGMEKLGFDITELEEDFL